MHEAQVERLEMIPVKEKVKVKRERGEYKTEQMGVDCGHNGGAKVKQPNIGDMQALRREGQDETNVLRIEGEVQGKEIVVVEEEEDNEVGLVKEGRRGGTGQVPDETLVKVDIVDTESEIEDDAVEVTGDLDYDIVVPEEEGGSRSNPMSEVEIVQAESLEEELDAEKDYEETEV